MLAAIFGQRAAERQAAFFLPHLRLGLRVLDVGWGPGSTTVSPAAAPQAGGAQAPTKSGQQTTLPSRTSSSRYRAARVSIPTSCAVAIPPVSSSGSSVRTVSAS